MSRPAVAIVVVPDSSAYTLLEHGMPRGYDADNRSCCHQLSWSLFQDLWIRQFQSTDSFPLQDRTLIHDTLVQEFYDVDSTVHVILHLMVNSQTSRQSSESCSRYAMHLFVVSLAPKTALLRYQIWHCPCCVFSLMATFFFRRISQCNVNCVFHGLRDARQWYMVRKRDWDKNIWSVLVILPFSLFWLANCTN